MHARFIWDHAISSTSWSNRRDIYRQVERYCAYPVVGEIVLATNVPMALPDFIVGKPTGVAALGRGWL